jgi:hypothetical protein
MAIILAASFPDKYRTVQDRALLLLPRAGGRERQEVRSEELTALGRQEHREPWSEAGRVPLLDDTARIA